MDEFNMDESWGLHPKSYKSVTERQILYDSTHMNQNHRQKVERQFPKYGGGEWWEFIV